MSATPRPAGDRPRPSWLIVIESDPRTSRRPAEAVRIAAGVAVWKSVDVRIYLLGPAVQILAKSRAALLDEDILAQSLPLLAAESDSILIDAASGQSVELNATEFPYRAVTIKEAAEIAAQSSTVSRF